MLAACGAGEGRATDDSQTDDGRRIYQEGLLPDGQPIKAVVAGDVPVLGTQFSCENCHGRSGMGTGENEYIVPPVAGPFLFSESPQPARPAYTPESLATVLRDGITPGGRTLKVELMPLYDVDDAAVDALASYLATLSSGNSPGVSDSTIRFAIAMGGDVDETKRQAVLTTIRAFFDVKNRQTRLDGERWDRGYSPESRLPTVFRKWILDEWVLAGPEETWEAQLDRYYEQAPAFAMISGLAEGSWEPVGRFCQRRALPCLYPATDRPWVDPDNYYTVFYSRGLGLEADLIASHLAADPPETLVQVYCDGDGEWAAARLREKLAIQTPSLEDLRLDCDMQPIKEQMMPRDAGSTVFVYWVDRVALHDLLADSSTGRVYLSSISLDGNLEDITYSGTGEIFLAHSFELPGQIDAARGRFEAWARSRGIELTAPRAQAEAFYASLVLGDTLKHMGRFYIRDYMLDMLEHAQGLMQWVPYHPRTTIGPKQRFLSKGGYVLPIRDSGIETENAEWILP